MNFRFPIAATSGRRSLLALLCIVFNSVGVSQEATSHILSYGAATEVGMSPGILKGAFSYYQEAVGNGDVVGVVVLVARHGRVVLHEAAGLSDRDQGRPMRTDTLFHMASNTKPVIAAAVAQLVEAKKLDYSDPVRNYLPSWDNYRAGFITIDHLLSHTSGFRIGSLFLPPDDQNNNLQQAVARFGEVGAEATPGTTYSYSNPGFNTLGALIEIASDSLLESYLDAHIYTPLGMHDSYNYQAGHRLEGKSDRLGPVYYKRDDDGEWIPGQATTIPFARGSGGMVSTTWDYALFCQMVLNGGEYADGRILTQRSVDLMLSEKAERAEGAYGYGWVLNGNVAGHSGSDGTHAWIDRKKGVIGLVFTQTPKGCPPISRFRQLVNLSIMD